MFEKSERLKKIPPFLFAEVRRKIRAVEESGVDLVNLAIGDPVEPTPEPIVQELCRAATTLKNQRYPTRAEKGMDPLRISICDWYAERYDARLDAETECLMLIGSKEAAHHFSLALINAGDTVLVTDPGYPVYLPAIWFAGGEPVPVPIREERNYLPDLDAIPEDVAIKAKAFFLNYPNNPIGAVATREFLEKLVRFAHKYEILLFYDNPYIEIVFDDAQPLSILSIDGAKEVAVELNSFSKTFNMTGWRLGMALGNEKIIGAMDQVKANTDMGVFNAIQYAGIAALEQCANTVGDIRKVYQRRRKLVVDALKKMGWEFTPQKGTFYLWTPTPKGMKSMECADRILYDAHVVVAPGSGYGQYGEGYIRFSLTAPDDRLQEAMTRLQSNFKP